eukprot:10187503-Karenia_brevis.AAC.1
MGGEGEGHAGSEITAGIITTTAPRYYQYYSSRSQQEVSQYGPAALHPLIRSRSNQGLCGYLQQQLQRVWNDLRSVSFASSKSLYFISVHSGGSGSRSWDWSEEGLQGCPRGDPTGQGGQNSVENYFVPTI